MRMRKKKNLETRLEEYSSILKICKTDDKNFDTAANEKEYLDFEDIFGNDHPVYAEIGCGKGSFIKEIAKQNPDINFIAVEKCANVIVDACKKCVDEKITNVYFLQTTAEYLEKYIKPNTIGRIFLNFSCPYPKNSYASHRLTAPRFLNIYKNLMEKDAEIWQKTDNMKLFEFSIEQFSNNGFGLKDVSLDLHNSGFEGNIMTEYEEKFSSLGMPIYRLVAFKNP